jgi:hypothetical protein
MNAKETSYKLYTPRRSTQPSVRKCLLKKCHVLKYIQQQCNHFSILLTLLTSQTSEWGQRITERSSAGHVANGVQCDSKIDAPQKLIICMARPWRTLRFGGRLESSFQCNRYSERIILATVLRQSCKGDKTAWLNTSVPPNAMITATTPSPDHAPSHCQPAFPG